MYTSHDIPRNTTRWLSYFRSTVEIFRNILSPLRVILWKIVKLTVLIGVLQRNRASRVYEYTSYIWRNLRSGIEIMEAGKSPDLKSAGWRLGRAHGVGLVQVQRLEKPGVPIVWF